MIKRSARICAMLLVLVLLALTGCRAPAGETPDEQPEQSADYSEKLVFTANVENAEAIPGTALWEYFQSKFNVEFELIAMAFNERHNMVRLLVSSGSVPDLMWMDLDESMFAEYANWALQGMFQAYPTMQELEQNWPNIAALYNEEDFVGDELMTIDGKQYAHPNRRENPEYNYMSGMGWIYRRDWAKALGLYQENDLYSWEEWVALNRAFVECNVSGSSTVGIGTMVYYFPMALGVYQTSAQYGYGTFSPQDGQYVWNAARPETLEGLMIAKRLYDEEIAWQENSLGQAPQDVYTAGNMGSLFYQITFQSLYAIRRALRENFPDLDENDAAALAKVIGPDGTIWCKQSQCYYGAVLMAANIGEEKMRRWLDMLDWMDSEEGTIFRAYGIEGVDWRRDAAGNIECLWPESDVLEGVRLTPYPESSRIFFNRYANAITRSETPDISMPKQYLDDIDDYFQFLRDYGFMRTFDYESSYLSAGHKNKMGNISELVADKMTELVTTASEEELPALWQGWLDEMEPEIEPVLDELNSLIDDVPIEEAPRLYQKE